jgi:hypothetical protein
MDEKAGGLLDRAWGLAQFAPQLQMAQADHRNSKNTPSLRGGKSLNVPWSGDSEHAPNFSGHRDKRVFLKSGVAY